LVVGVGSGVGFESSEDWAQPDNIPNTKEKKTDFI